MTDSVVTKYYGGAAPESAGAGMRKDGALSYLLSDHLGSNSLILDTAGNVVGETRYTAWGEERYASGSVSTDYTYTGQYSNTDDFGLMYYKARWYDPQLGRFAQTDTVVPDLSDPIAWDRYAYTLNNPIRFSDDSGHWVESALDIAFIAYDIYDISANGLNLENGLSLAADVAGLILPAVTGGGLAVRALTHVDDASKVVNAVDTALDVSNAIDNAVDSVNALDTAVDAANMTDNLADASKLPLEDHHFATNKNSIFTPQLEAIAQKYGLDLNGSWNRGNLPHRGRHPNDYHRWVLENMKAIDGILGGGVKNADEFIKLYTQNVITPVVSNPVMLRKMFWTGIVR